MTHKLSYILLIIILYSCSAANKVQHTDFDQIIFSEKSEVLGGTITIILKNSSDLHCNESNIIGVRLNGKVSDDLVMNFKGCIVSGNSEKGYLGVKPLCNEKNKNHKLTIAHRIATDEYTEITTFDLDEIL